VTNARIQSYRLGQRDEREVRWALGLDLKGDVGFKSGFGAFLNEMLLRSCLAPWVEKKPPQKFSGYHVDLRDHAGQCIAVNGHEHRTQLTYEMSDEITSASSKHSHVWHAISELSEEQWFALSVRYGKRPPLPAVEPESHGQENAPGHENHEPPAGVVEGAEEFHDLGTLAGFTKTAQASLYRDHYGIIGGLRGLSYTVGHPLDVDPIRADADIELFERIYAEADALLSSACRTYVAASKQAERAEIVARLMRSKG
jgi:hypothetical protein